MKAWLGILKNSTTEQEWNKSCDEIKEAHGGEYPAWWFSEVVLSGLATQTRHRFGW